MIATTQPKAPKGARHQHAKYAAQPSDSDGPKATPKQQRSNRRNQDRNAPPQWQDSQATGNGQGDFDENGNFTLPGVESIESEPMYEDMDVISGVKRPNKKAQRAKNGTPRQISPPQQTNQYNAQAMNVPVPSIATPSKPAYAGPTFHASPAASALPLPKFFSKSVPAATSESSMQARLDQESEKNDKSDSRSPAEATPALAVPPRQEESPLDILFKADKEEKAKRKSTGIGMTPISKPAISQVNSDPPRGGTQWAEIYSRPNAHTRQPSNGMFNMEMDGSPAPPHHPSPPHVNAERRTTTAPSIIPQSTAQNGLFNPPSGQQMYSAPDHGYSMPTLVSQSLTPTANFAPPKGGSSPFYRPSLPHTPRSVGSTPIQQSTVPYNQQQPLHYGNRNLSPVFKAVKQDSVRHTSSLRQEVHPSSPVLGTAELPENDLNATPSRRPSARADQAALSYLEKNVPPPPSMPKLDLRSLSNSSVPTNFAPTELAGKSQTPANKRTPQTSLSRSHSAQQSLQSGSNIDVKAMEQDLRRILNLNVFGSTPGVPSVR